MCKLLLIPILFTVACSKDPALQGYEDRIKELRTDFSTTYVPEKELTEAGCRFRALIDDFDFECKATTSARKIIQEQEIATYVTTSKTVLAESLPANRALTESILIQKKMSIDEYVEKTEHATLGEAYSIRWMAIDAATTTLEPDKAEQIAVSYLSFLVWNFPIRFQLQLESLKLSELGALDNKQKIELEELTNDLVKLLRSSKGASLKSYSSISLNALEIAEDITERLL